MTYYAAPMNPRSRRAEIRGPVRAAILWVIVLAVSNWPSYPDAKHVGYSAVYNSLTPESQAKLETRHMPPPSPDHAYIPIALTDPNLPVATLRREVSKQDGRGAVEEFNTVLHRQLRAAQSAFVVSVVSWLIVQAIIVFMAGRWLLRIRVGQWQRGQLVLAWGAVAALALALLVMFDGDPTTPFAVVVTVPPNGMWSHFTPLSAARITMIASVSAVLFAAPASMFVLTWIWLGARQPPAASVT